MSDPASEILAVAAARCVVTGGLTAGGDWSYRSRPDAVIKLDAVIRGSCWLIADDGAPIRLDAGDAVVLNGVTTMVLCSDPESTPVDSPPAGSPRAGFFTSVGIGEDVAILGGHIELDPGSADLFTSAFPAVLHLDASSTEAQSARGLIDRIVEEAGSDRPGARFAADLHAQMLLVEVLRAGLRHGSLPRAGWLGLLSDVDLRPAVVAMHADPARAWGLEELAAVAGLSRSHFAQRFRDASGQPPLTYLSHWRVHLARRALRTSQTTIAALAGELGYASESSFTHAFTRIAGESPARYRRRTAAL